MEGFRLQIEIIVAILRDFQKTSKYAIAYVRLVLTKIEVDGFSESRHEIYVKYEFDLKTVLKSLGCK